MPILTCPVCGSGQCRSLAGGTRTRCRRCGYDSGIADATPRLKPCPSCNSPTMFLRYNGTIICRACQALFDKDMKPITEPVKEPVAPKVKNPDELTGSSRLHYLIKQAKDLNRDKYRIKVASEPNDVIQL